MGDTAEKLEKVEEGGGTTLPMGVPLPSNVADIRNIVIPIGVGKNELPEFSAVLIRRREGTKKDGSERTPPFYMPYDGVQVPFNLATSLVRANGMAIARGSGLQVAAFGASRLIERFEGDPDRVRRVIGGREGAEATQFMQGSIEAERIRICLVRAIGEVLGLQNLGEILPTARLLREKESFRDDVLQTVALVRDKIADRSSNVDFFGMPTTFRYALKHGLPNGKRKDALASDFVSEGNEDLPYLGSEIAIINYLIRELALDYISHRGSDISFEDRNGCEHTQIECLREVTVNAFGGDELGLHWEVTSELDGGAFYMPGSPDKKSGRKIMPVDYYYIDQDSVDPAPDKRGKVPLTVPLAPWRTSWMKHNANSGRGGLAGGQVVAFLNSHIRPVIAQYLATHETSGRLRFAEDVGSKFSSEKLDSMLAWATLKDEDDGRPDAPHFDGIGDFNDMVRVVCRHVVEEALPEITKKPE